MGYHSENLLSRGTHTCRRPKAAVQIPYQKKYIHHQTNSGSVCQNTWTSLYTVQCKYQTIHGLQVHGLVHTNSAKSGGGRSGALADSDCPSFQSSSLIFNRKATHVLRIRIWHPKSSRVSKRVLLSLREEDFGTISGLAFAMLGGEKGEKRQKRLGRWTLDPTCQAQYRGTLQQ